MLELIANRIVVRISQTTDLTGEQLDVCLYGCESCLYSVISTIALLMTGWLFGAMLEATLIVFVFYCCQSLGGGYHASSHLKCFTTMFVFLSICCFFLKSCNVNLIYSMMAVISSLFLFSIPVQIHINKHYLFGRKKHFAIVSRIFTCAMFALMLIFHFIDLSVFRSICVGLTVSSASRIAARIKQHRCFFQDRAGED